MTDELHITEEQIKQVVPLQRRGTEDDIGGMILYLASKVGECARSSQQHRLMSADVLGWSLCQWQRSTCRRREASLVSGKLLKSYDRLFSGSRYLS